MKLPKRLDRRLGFALGAASLLLGMVAPAVMPVFASAAQITNRSIQMSNSLYGATSNYDITFTPVTTGAQFVTIIFCAGGNSPIVGDACSAPSGMSLTGATLDTADSTDHSAAIDATDTATANTIVIDDTLASGANSIVLDGITNTSTIGTFYARVQTYPNAGAAGTAQVATTPGTPTDFGGFALATTNSIGVTAYVEETMVFCVSGSVSAPTAQCATNNTAPSPVLGTTTGSETILGNTLSTANVWAQMSTNAANGAVVYMKSDATSCGGLYLAFQTSTCGIPPQNTSGNTISNGTGKFGLLVSTDSGATGGTTPTGTLEAAASSHYGATNYYMDYQSGNTTGVTSPYGSPLLDSAGAPVANENVALTLGADTSPTTPAGKYVANLNTIAVGTF